MSPIPDPPEAKPIRSATWMKIVGAGFAFLLVLAFLGLGILASMRNDVVFGCDAFSFLAPAFAIGAAMSAVFLGGGAAIAGNLGEYFQTRPLTVSLTGGVAVLVIMFGIFFGLQPEDCGSQGEARLEFRAVPDALTVDPGSSLWTRENTHDARDTYEVAVLVTAGVAQEVLEVLENGSPVCQVTLSFANGFPAEAEGHDYEFFEMPAPASFKLDYAGPGGDREERVAVDDCFRHGQRRLIGELVVSLTHGQVRFARPKPSEEPSVNEFAGGSAPAVLPREETRLLGGLIAAAQAQSVGMDYTELREMLGSTNEKLRVEARRLLAAEFDSYARPALEDLFNPRSRLSPELLTSLLHGLIGGIEARVPGLAPQAGRDLAQPLPYVQGREAELVELTAHFDSSVRQQARRLIQRYPVDAFVPQIDHALTRAETSCPDERLGWQVYAAVFFTYNRMIQAGLDGAITPETAPGWDRQTDRIQALVGRCVSGPEAADAALLDYGRATVYGWAGETGRVATAQSDFSTFLTGREADYYMQSHIERIGQIGG